ncbi:hypothetical protein [Bacillus massilinigeriensis]|uniref:hypothetical protein n=1 Tax=Bacillus mediterraneensis TaxID=1805474 RepID=UPI0008F900B8|nr:hypothetical protein [Bacillus mediterraneensis]
MGYILPMNNTSFQYMNYADRDAAAEFHSNGVEPLRIIQKLSPAKKGQEVIADSQQRLLFEGRQQRALKRKVNDEVLKRTYAEVTGKGQHISLSI